MLKYVINSRITIGLLFVFALALFPATATESKYVWEDTMILNFTVSDPDSTSTSLPYADGLGERGASDEVPSTIGGPSLGASSSSQNETVTTSEELVTAETETSDNNATIETRPDLNGSDDATQEFIGLKDTERTEKDSD